MNKYSVEDGKAVINSKVLNIDTVVIEKVGPYGANGVIFYGRQERLERKVAVKFWFEMEKGKESGELQPLLEVRKPATFTHSNIVQVHDVGEVEGYFYSILEYIEGQTLKDWLTTERSGKENGGKPEFAERLRVWNTIVKVMKEVHSKPIYHGDLHWENILITDSGHIKIIDFGTSEKPKSKEYSKSREGKVISETALKIFPECKSYSDLIIIEKRKGGSPRFTSLKNWVEKRRLDEVIEPPEAILATLDNWVQVCSKISDYKNFIKDNEKIDDYALKNLLESLAMLIIDTPLFDLENLISVIQSLNIDDSYISYFLSRVSTYWKLEITDEEAALVDYRLKIDINDLKVVYEKLREMFINRFNN